MNTVSNTPLMKTAMKPLHIDIVEVNDDDTTTCVTVPANEPTTIMVPVFDAQNDSIAVKILTHHEESCLSYKDSDIYVMVKIIPPFRTNTEGTFRKCQPAGANQESALHAQFFNCTCEYGQCQDFYIRIVSKCQIRICDTEVYPLG